ncbi:MAG: YezD family protein [Candidatus Omnitrophica bacterium]|jgi:hypothetical protein|nr:YezD family protein [Candidatus Omnitrophota bacterium]MDD5584847.1 YezD family protein [Candidatus Omnitrophota bacterium]
MENKTLKLEEKEKQRIAHEVLRAIGNIEYGEVVLTIHDSKVVQIEKREKRRFK